MKKTKISLVPLMILVFLSGSLEGLAADTPPTLGPNLVTNANLIDTDSSGKPVGWKTGKWGNNSAIWSYLPAGASDPGSVSVTVANYVSGDAKWYFEPVAVTAGRAYRFSDHFKANEATTLTVWFQKSDGASIYKDIGNLSPTADWSETVNFFTAPTGAVKATVFHLLKKNGVLATDNYDLREIIPGAADPDNLIKNGSFENQNGGNPTFWKKGKWGGNDAIFTFPGEPRSGFFGAKVSIQNYSSGAAEWYFDDVPVAGYQAYKFIDYSKSSVTTYATARFTLSDGSFRYQDLGNVPAASDWQKFERTFVAPAGAISVSVFHLIKSPGVLEVDDYFLAKTEDPDAFAEGLVSLDFDDGFKTTYEQALPLLTQYNLKSTQYIVTGYLSFPAYMGSEQVLEFQNKGHEIGAHTRTHRDLTTLSASELQSEVTGSRDDLLAVGINIVNSFAYPFGAFNGNVISAVQTAGFQGARGTWGGVIGKTDNRYTLRRFPVARDTTFASVKSAIDSARDRKRWQILVFHSIGNNPDDPYESSPELLEQILAYLSETNTKVVTVNEGLALMAQ